MNIDPATVYVLLVVIMIIATFAALWWWIEIGSARMHWRQANEEVNSRLGPRPPPRRPGIDQLAVALARRHPSWSRDKCLMQAKVLYTSPTIRRRGTTPPRRWEYVENPCYLGASFEIPAGF